MTVKMIAVGNLGRDPEMRYTPSGSPVTSFSVASNRKYKTQAGEQVKESTWVRVSVFGKTAEACSQYLKKGSKVYVEGRLTIDPATGGPKIFTRQDGTSGASFEIVATEVEFLSGNGEHTEGEGAPAPAEDEIPF